MDELIEAMTRQLRVFVRAAYQKHGLALPIVEPLGDVPFALLPDNRQLVADTARGTQGKYDLWADGDMVELDLDLDKALALVA